MTERKCGASFCLLLLFLMQSPALSGSRQPLSNAQPPTQSTLDGTVSADEWTAKAVENDLQGLRWKLRRFVSNAKNTIERFTNKPTLDATMDRNATTVGRRRPLLRMRQRMRERRRNASSNALESSQFYGALSDKFQQPQYELHPELLSIRPTMQNIVGTAANIIADKPNLCEQENSTNTSPIIPTSLINATSSVENVAFGSHN